MSAGLTIFFSLGAISFILSICESSVTNDSLLGLWHPVVGPQHCKRGASGKAPRNGPQSHWCWRLRKTRDDAHFTRFDDHALDYEMAMVALRSITRGSWAASSGLNTSAWSCASNDASRDLSELLVHQLAARSGKARFVDHSSGSLPARCRLQEGRPC